MNVKVGCRSVLHTVVSESLGPDLELACPGVFCVFAVGVSCDPDMLCSDCQHSQILLHKATEDHPRVPQIR